MVSIISNAINTQIPFYFVNYVLLVYLLCLGFLIKIPARQRFLYDNNLVLKVFLQI